jgi:Ca2+-binding EF-hand superfamily protein
LSPALFPVLEATFSSADSGGSGWIDDTAFASALRRAIPSLSWSEVGAALSAMHLEGVKQIDYTDFVAALTSLATGDGLLPPAGSSGRS